MFSPRLHAWTLWWIFLVAGTAVCGDKPSLDLGPEVCITAKEEFGHFESSLAVDPEDPRRLVVACNTHNLPGAIDMPGPWTCSTYQSTDGGRTWAPNGRVADVKQGDALVVFGTGGRAFFACLAAKQHIAVWQSSDLGAKWAGPFTSEFEKADYEKMVVDRTNGPNRGRLYVHARVGKRELRLLTLELGTARPKALADVSYGAAEGGFVDPPLVLADGTLFLPYHSQATIHTENKMYTGSSHDLFCRTSTDGGKTFSPERSITHVDDKRGPAGGGPPAYGIGRLDGRDRIYLVRAGTPNGIARLYLRTSDDAGKSWSDERDITPATDPDGKADLPSVPSLAVSPEGVVGVSWLSMRKAGYRALFMASADGGAKWSDPVFLSTADSGEPKYDARFPNGDYTLIDAAAGNVFHPIWQDSRNERRSHIYHRSVKVKVQ